MRIAYVITGLGKGGAETQLSRLVLGVQKQHSVVVISLTGDGPTGVELRKHGVKVINLSGTFTIFFKLRKAIRSFKPDIVHSFMWHANILSRFAAIGSKAKVVSSIRFREQTRFRLYLDTLTRPLADAITANSKAIAKFGGKKCIVIYNGVPASFWKGQKYTPKKKHALMLAHLRPEKDHNTVLDVAKRLPDWRFTLVGDGSRRAELEARCTKENITNVIFEGFQSDARSYLLRASCLLHLSFSEGMPNAVIEAMLIGVPVIASDIPENRELVFGHGALVPLRSINKTITAIQNSEKLSNKITLSAQSWARKTFDEKKMIASYADLYSELYN